MKSIRYSPLVKVLLHIALFASGFLILFGVLSLSDFLSRYGAAASFTETAEFEERYSKYLERLALYIMYREQGLESESKRYNSVELSPSDYNYLNERGSEQTEFEFYDQKLNYDDTSFVYYVKNLENGIEYFSPSLSASTEPDERITAGYLEQIRDNPAYFILDTSDMVYSTNVSRNGYISKSSADWIAKCINGSLYPSQPSSVLSLEAVPSHFLVYTSIRPGFPGQGDDFAPLYQEFSALSTKKQVSCILLPASILLFLAFFLLTIANTGHSGKQEGIVLLKTDQIYTELYIGSFFLFLFLLSMSAIRHLITGSLVSLFYLAFPGLAGSLSLSALLLILYCVVYPFAAFFFFGLIRRMKAKKMFSHSLLSRIWNGLRRFMENKEVTWSAALYFFIVCIFLALSIFFFVKRRETAGVLLFLAGLGFGARHLFRAAADLNVLVEETRRIAEGDFDHTIQENELAGPMKRLGGYINHIGDGLSTALEEQLKSERLKTELITNVSHDIKTPLTSIINYVDLLKKEKLENPKAAGYLEVLGKKTWRLKNLIEDLVDASKASSGSVTLNMEKLNIVELLRQLMGEYEDRFLQNHLEAVLTAKQDPVYIMADGRSTCRIIENMFSNANKYALCGTRIYIDILPEEGPPASVSVSVKNVSAQKLNIPSEELMERFVRGDLARSSEGSGLGLSIAKSLARLQGASFDICLDGDLFKAILRFPILII